MHQHEIAVLNLGREHTDLRLDVRARIVICDNEFAVGRAGLLREGIIAPEREDKKSPYRLRINGQSLYDTTMYPLHCERIQCNSSCFSFGKSTAYKLSASKYGGSQ